MRYTVVPVTPFEQNCTIFWCEKTRRAVVIDPGGDIERILQTLTDEGLTLEKILVTHGHIDHAGGVAALAGRCGDCAITIPAQQKEKSSVINDLVMHSYLLFTEDRVRRRLIDQAIARDITL